MRSHASFNNAVVTRRAALRATASPVHARARTLFILVDVHYAFIYERIFDLASVVGHRRIDDALARSRDRATCTDPRAMCSHASFNYAVVTRRAALRATAIVHARARTLVILVGIRAAKRYRRVIGHPVSRARACTNFLHPRRESHAETSSRPAPGH
jgi:hypothetical protein